MVQSVGPGPVPAGRNGAARKSLIASIFFLATTLVILASNSLALSPWVRPFSKANPDHPISFFLGVLFEITFLCMPFNFLASLIVVLVGLRGLGVAGRSKDGTGRGESIIGIGLSMLVMFLSVAGFFQWGSAFKQ